MSAADRTLRRLTIVVARCRQPADYTYAATVGGAMGAITYVSMIATMPAPVLSQLPGCVEDYNENHPHKAL
jgi:hypothetical protein